MMASKIIRFLQEVNNLLLIKVSLKIYCHFLSVFDVLFHVLIRFSLVVCFSTINPSMLMKKPLGISSGR